MNAATKFLMTQGSMAPQELAMWLGDAATLQAAHALLSVKKDDWVPGATQFWQHKEAILQQWQVAAGMNLATTPELDEAITDALHDINTNANYIVLRAKHEKNDAWLYNSGYQFKDGKRNHNKTVSAHPLHLTVKNGPDISEVTLRWNKDPAAGSYQLQMCIGTPQGEASYADQGYYRNVSAIIGNLERATWVYFRVRSVGNNEVSPWSEPVGIIVT